MSGDVSSFQCISTQKNSCFFWGGFGGWTTTIHVLQNQWLAFGHFENYVFSKRQIKCVNFYWFHGSQRLGYTWQIQCFSLICHAFPRQSLPSMNMLHPWMYGVGRDCQGGRDGEKVETGRCQKLMFLFASNIGGRFPIGLAYFVEICFKTTFFLRYWCSHFVISPDIQAHSKHLLLSFVFWTTKLYLNHQTSEGTAGCVGFGFEMML